MDDLNLSQLLKIRTLLSVEGLGNVKLLKLAGTFGSLDAIFNSSLKSLTSTPLIDHNLAARILTAIESPGLIESEVEKEISTLSKINGRFITYWDENFPTPLRQIYMPPVLLYYLGELKKEDTQSIAIVGTRVPTHYGKLQAEKLASELTERNVTVVSGLARGIDSAAHRATINQNGRTIAITGAGLDVIYPHENKKLYHEIAEKGVIISEYKPGTKPDAQNFPKRNRIIAGLTLGTLVIETKLNGGAMQTAAFALEQNKEVFAIPGNINSPMSEGTNRLIQNGEAKLVTNAEDIITELESKIFPATAKAAPKPELDLNMFESKIYELLSEEPKHIDKIAIDSGMNTSECLVNLLTLEFKGACRQLPGKTFIRL